MLCVYVFIITSPMAISLSFVNILTSLILYVGKCVLGEAVEGKGEGHSRELPEEGGVGHKKWIRRRGGK